MVFFFFVLLGRHYLMKDFLLLFLLNSVKDKAGYLLNGYSHNYIISVFMKQSDTLLTFHNFFSSFFLGGGGLQLLLQYNLLDLY